MHIDRKFYYFETIKNSGIYEEWLLDSLKYELDKRVYYYGGHFKYPYERNIYNKITLKSKIAKSIKQFLKNIYLNFFYVNKIDKTKKYIISNAYFNLNNSLDSFFKSKNVDIIFIIPFWEVNLRSNFYPKSIIFLAIKLANIMNTASFNTILSKNTIDLIYKLKEELIKFFNENKNIIGFIAPNDMSFFENFTIKIAKLCNVKSAIFLHGLPGRYNSIDENRADLLFIWGSKIKELYAKAGVNKDKIIVSGFPKYKKLDNKILKSNFKRILVLTKSINGAQINSDSYNLSDRGGCIKYLFEIKQILTKKGVKKVYLRPHPSENPLWYKDFIDTDFYEFDLRPLNEVFSETGLIIGPISSVFIEAILNNVCYLPYEPVIDGSTYDLLNPVPPFDGSDSNIKVARNPEELDKLLDTYEINQNAIEGYIEEFKPEKIIESFIS